MKHIMIAATVAALTIESPAGHWYETTHEARNAWVARMSEILDSRHPPKEFRYRLWRCITDGAEGYKTWGLAQLTALCATLIER